MAQAVFSYPFDYDTDGGCGPFLDGSPNPVDATPTDWLEGSGQTFKTNDPVMFSGGYIVIATASSNEVGNLLGFAMNDASGTQGTPVQVRRIRNGDRFVMNYKNSGGSSVTAQSLVGSLTNFDIDTSVTGENILVANNGAAARDKPFGIIEHLYSPTNGNVNGDAVGDTNGRVVVKFNDYYLQ